MWKNWGRAWLKCEIRLHWIRWDRRRIQEKMFNLICHLIQDLWSRLKHWSQIWQSWGAKKLYSISMVTAESLQALKSWSFRPCWHSWGIDFRKCRLSLKTWSKSRPRWTYRSNRPEMRWLAWKWTSITTMVSWSKEAVSLKISLSYCMKRSRTKRRRLSGNISHREI